MLNQAFIFGTIKSDLISIKDMDNKILHLQSKNKKDVINLEVEIPTFLEKLMNDDNRLYKDKNVCVKGELTQKSGTKNFRIVAHKIDEVDFDINNTPQNHVILVGRLVRDFDYPDVFNGKVATSTLAVGRNYKNADGIYETDFLDVKAFSGIAESATSYLKKGDLVGIKGNISTYGDRTDINIDKLTFLNTSLSKKDVDSKISKDI